MNAETKRHIDTARQILVGVVPNPSTQIDQITNALIYKFMDDMDQSVIKIGGKPTFFTGELEKYAWVRIMDGRIGAQERMNLYGEALVKFSQSKQLPELFRDIFKSAFLPYRSPEVLDMFLKEINYFNYSHSEDLGDAFEYLLSVMSSQGDAGMFRTPRHIIEFIVDVVNPTKDDKILDPACGTAGFLISAYKHILEQHDGLNDPEKKEIPLTPEQKKKLTNSFIGYDISPEMVRLSRVNMYLHNFKDPQIVAYNTLADEERWNDKFDVILANPPFMTPKGAGKPHSKFTIQASKSEVLFVDYIMHHLRPKGRAGIIVPEGIIFSSGNSYKELRKNLIEDGLYGVVSLPSGVFNPYAGVKTSILLFDNEIAKQRSEIIFVKVENDGFDLGAQRRESQKNDLPRALEVLNKFKTMIGNGLSDCHDELDEWIKNHTNPLIREIKVQTVQKTKIAESGDYNLSGDRYRIATDYSNAKWPMVELGAIAEIRMGETLIKSDLTGTGRPIFSADTSNRPWMYSNKTKLSFGKKTIVIGARGTIGSIKLPQVEDFTCTQTTIAVTVNEKVNEKYVYFQLSNFDFSSIKEGVGIPMITVKSVSKIKIPLPPLKIQEQTVAELDNYQNIITGAKQIISNWKPKIEFDLRWEKVKLNDVCEIVSKLVNPRDDEFKNLLHVGGANIISANGELINMQSVENEKLISGKFIFDETVVLYNKIRPYLMKVARPNFRGLCSADIYPLKPSNNRLMRDFLFSLLLTPEFTEYAIQGSGRVGMPKVNREYLFDFSFGLPPLTIQKQIVSKIEAERSIVESNKKLIEIYEQKTKDAIAKLWEE
jgi:type I restriction enzyme M protein